MSDINALIELELSDQLRRAESQVAKVLRDIDGSMDLKEFDFVINIRSFDDDRSLGLQLSSSGIAEVMTMAVERWRDFTSLPEGSLRAGFLVSIKLPSGTLVDLSPARYIQYIQ